MCPNHNVPLDSFCEQCNGLVCSGCNHGILRRHETFPLNYKSRVLFEKLDSILRASRKQGHEINERIRILHEYEEEIEVATRLAIERIERHYKAEKEKILQLTARHMTKIEDEKLMLESFEQQRRMLENTSRKLIAQINNPDFVKRTKKFLSNNQPQNLPLALRIGEFRTYMQQNFLGYIDTVRAETKESRYQGTFDPQVSTERAQSIDTVSDEPIATALSDTSSTNSSQPDSTVIHYKSDYQENIIDGHPSQNLTAVKVAKLVSYTNLKRFEGSHLKLFSSALFYGESLWISGWNKNMFNRKDTVIVNARLPDFITVQKKKKYDQNAEQPTIMAVFGDNILFAKTNGNKLYSLNLTSKRISEVFSPVDLTIAAICTSHQHVFVLNRNQSDDINVLDSNFQQEGKISLNIGNIQDCAMNMCVINQQQHSGLTPRSSNTSGYLSTSDFRSTFNFTSLEVDASDTNILIGTSLPKASLRVVNLRNGILWQLNRKTNPELGLKFNPCSLTASHAGDIYFADKGTNRVSIVVSQ